MISSVSQAQQVDLPTQDSPPIWNRVLEIFKRVISSPLFWATLKVAALIGVTITSLAFPALIPVTILAPTLGVGLVTLGIEVYLLHKPLAYEFLLYFGLFENWIHPENRPWWSTITDNVILGAIPLKNKKHIKKIEREGVSSVLSILELFELTPKMLSVPANYEDWAKRNIRHKQIPAADFKPVPVHQLAEAVEYIHDHVHSGGKVYVHCKSGVGRSTMVVSAYLLKYHPRIKTVRQAVSYIKERRPQVHLNDEQMATLEEYFIKCV